MAQTFELQMRALEAAVKEDPSSLTPDSLSALDADQEESDMRE